MLPHTLLSRFDLIFLILDPQDEVYDARLARHLVGLYYRGTRPKNLDSETSSGSTNMGIGTRMDRSTGAAYLADDDEDALGGEGVSAKLLRDYITYAKVCKGSLYFIINTVNGRDDPASYNYSDWMIGTSYFLVIPILAFHITSGDQHVI
ncbi:unnamed protein product [Protopolystoma xenopodis]|uniref:MCM C-terminal AAA(+) ATPase domain-containing protein n=1 Tax=Protopolystoma xenopodis TaxID=117903 RepID=A0A3S5B6N9_9PLAT|nr:unnamed protein product [Protopolystoma xenopodis]